MASRPRRSAGAPKRFSPPPVASSTRKRGQTDVDSLQIKIEQPDEEVPAVNNSVEKVEEHEDEPQSAKKARTPRNVAKMTPKKEPQPKPTKTTPTKTPKKTPPKVASKRTPARSAKKNQAEEVESLPRAVKIELPDEIGVEEYSIPEVILARATQQPEVSEVSSRVKKEKPNEEVANKNEEKKKRKHLNEQNEPENLPIKANKSSSATEKAHKDKTAKKSIEEDEDEVPIKRTKPMIRTDKVPLAALLAGEPIKPLSRKVIAEQEAAKKAIEDARKEKSTTRVHKFDLEDETNEIVLKKSKHHKEHKERKEHLSHKSVVSTKTTTTSIASTSTYIVTNDHLSKRKSSHDDSSSKNKEKTPVIMSRKHSDQHDKSSSLQKRPEQKKSFDATKPKLTIRTDKPSPSGDPFKKPRPVQPSPVQRSPAIVKPSSSGGLGAFDLLDSIMEKQDRTMQELNKSEEQKANERQRLEMERRRKSAENPFEKGAAFSSGKGANLPVNQPLSVNVKTDGSQQSTPSDTAGSINTPRESRTSQDKSPKTLPKERTSKSESTEKSPIGMDKQPQQTTPKERAPIDFTEETQSTATEPVKTIEQTIQVTQTTIVELSLDDIPLPDEIPPNHMSVETSSIKESPKESASNEILLTQTVAVTQQTTTVQVETTSIETEKEDESLSTVDDEEVKPYEPEMLPGVEVDDSMNDAELIASANLILKNLQQSSANVSASGVNITYEQVVISDDESTNSAKDPEEKPPMDFYGEPVPEDDDEDDKLFEMAAGMPKSKKGEVKKIEEEALPNNETIELDYYNADINIKSDVKNKWLIDPDNGDGFALMWGCVRSNYGLFLPNNVNDRSSLPPYIVYQVQVKEYLPIKHLPFEEPEPYEVRLGWSADSVKSIVGESQNSYAYCSTGRKAAGNIFSDFGQNAQILDYITVVLDLLNNELRIFLNDTDLGAAHTDLRFNSPGSTDSQTIVFPHIGLKNVRCFVNFGVEQPDPDSTSQWPVPGFLADKPYKFFGELNRFPNNIVATPRPPPSKSDCTVIFMVGLPASGKSRWVEQYLREHENERWIVLNSDAMLNLMRVNGVPRKRVHQGRWDAVMGLAAKAASRAFQLICRRRHNYIIDQTNVSRDKRKQKLALFQDFIRKCAVLVPSVEDFEHRQMMQARSDPAGQITPEALLQLKGMFTLPEAEHEPFEELVFIEPPPERIGEAVELIRRFNDEGRPYLPVYNQRRL